MSDFVFDVNSVVFKKGVVSFDGDLRQFGGVVADIDSDASDLEFIDSLMSAIDRLCDNIKDDGVFIANEKSVLDNENIKTETDVMLYHMQQKRNKNKYNNLSRFFNKYAKNDAGLNVYATPNGFETALTLNGENRTFGQPQSTVYASLVNCAYAYSKHISTKKTDGFNALNDGGYAGKEGTSFKF